MDDAVEDFANELNREDLHIGQLLGGGEFAEVYRGTLNKNSKKVDVAIKTLRVRSISKTRIWADVHLYSLDFIETLQSLIEQKKFFSILEMDY